MQNSLFYECCINFNYSFLSKKSPDFGLEMINCRDKHGSKTKMPIDEWNEKEKNVKLMCLLWLQLDL